MRDRTRCLNAIPDQRFWDGQGRTIGADGHPTDQIFSRGKRQAPPLARPCGRRYSVMLRDDHLVCFLLDLVDKLDLSETATHLVDEKHHLAAAAAAAVAGAVL